VGAVLLFLLPAQTISKQIEERPQIQQGQGFKVLRRSLQPFAAGAARRSQQGGPIGRRAAAAEAASVPVSGPPVRRCACCARDIVLQQPQPSAVALAVVVSDQSPLLLAIGVDTPWVANRQLPSPHTAPPEVEMGDLWSPNDAVDARDRFAFNLAQCRIASARYQHTRSVVLVKG
jgi:hypothetical protein